MELDKNQILQVKKVLKKYNFQNKKLFNDFLDHSCCIIEHEMEEGASFESALEKALEKFSGSEMKNTELFTLKTLNMETSFSNRIALLATIPFMLLGLEWALSTQGNLLLSKGMHFFALSVSFLSMFVLLGMGWIKDFPRWSFPAIGFCLFMSLFLMSVKVPFLSENLLGLWAWLPLLVTMLLAILIHPSKEPIKNFVYQIAVSPGLILFMLYGLSLPVFMIAYDEVYTPSMFFIAIITTSVLSLGLYFILLSKTKMRRRLSMLSAFALAIIIVVLFYSLR